MLGVGWTEMLVIGVVALIVIGPKDLPLVMGRIGKFAATIRRMGSEFQRELNKTTGLNEIANLRNSVTAPLKATADAIRKEFNTTTATGAVQPSGALKPADPKVESVVDEIKAAAGMTPAAPAAAAPAMTPLATPAPELSITAVPAKPKRTPRVKVPTVTPVAVADIPPAAKPARAARKTIESPAPVEAIAPANAAKPTTKAAAKQAASKPVVTMTGAPKAPLKAATVAKAPAAKAAPAQAAASKAAPAPKAKTKATAPAAEPAAPVATKEPATRKKT
jgi:sec-independent protein translocase protein TatB